MLEPTLLIHYSINCFVFCPVAVRSLGHILYTKYSTNLYIREKKILKYHNKVEETLYQSRNFKHIQLHMKLLIWSKSQKQKKFMSCWIFKNSFSQFKKFKPIEPLYFLSDSFSDCFYISLFGTNNSLSANFEKTNCKLWNGKTKSVRTRNFRPSPE